LSSILTALKKLENEEQQKQEDIRSLSRAVHEKKLKSQNSLLILQTIKKSGFIFAAFILMLGVGFSGFKYLSQKNIISTAVNSIKSQKRSSYISETEHYMQEKKKEFPAVVNQTSDKSNMLLTKTADNSNKINIKSTKAEPVSEQAKTEETTMVLKTPTMIDAMPDKSEKQIPVRVENDSILKLQAIAWSDDPQSRIAVIDGQIVREGETISGASIIHINENEVIIKENGEELRLLFKLQK
jgi:type II secretory pathway component PulC